jgi:hypothetical protein
LKKRKERFLEKCQGLQHGFAIDNATQEEIAEEVYFRNWTKTYRNDLDCLVSLEGVYKKTIKQFRRWGLKKLAARSAKAMKVPAIPLFMKFVKGKKVKKKKRKLSRREQDYSKSPPTDIRSVSTLGFAPPRKTPLLLRSHPLPGP